MLANLNPDLQRGFWLGMGALGAMYLLGLVTGVFKKVL